MSVTIDNDELIQAANSFGYGQQHIIETSNGILYAVQINDANVIEVHKSEDDGATWALDTSFGSLTTPYHLSLCKSELNDIFLCFVHNTNYIVIKKRDHASGAWSEIYNTQATTPVGSYQFALLVSGRTNSNLYLFYCDPVGSRLACKVSSNYGSTWGNENLSAVSGGSGFALYGAHAAPNGNVYVLWWSPGTYASYRYLCTEIWNMSGNHVGKTGEIVIALANVLGGQIAVDSANNRWRISYYLSGTNYYLIVDKNNVVSLNVNYSTTDTVNHGQVAIGIDNKDNVYIFYVKTADSICYYRKYTALTNTWGDETALSESVGIRPSCVLSVRSGGTKLRVIYTTDV